MEVLNAIRLTKENSHEPLSALHLRCMVVHSPSTN